MRFCGEKQCIIGEGPIWNDVEHKLYFTNGLEQEFCRYDITRDCLEIRKTSVGCAAFCFDRENRLIVSRDDGVFYLHEDDTVTPLYDCRKYTIRHGNDMKVGPDGRIYVGTQSEQRLGLSEAVDGRLYVIDQDGTVRVLLEGLRLSNGMDWSMDEQRFFHTDSDTSQIREYTFDRKTGTISFTGRQVHVPGVDGLTVNSRGEILAACWGQGHVAVVDSHMFCIRDRIPVPASIPASCGFAGEQMEYLAVTTATLGVDQACDRNAGRTILIKMSTPGRKPYRFG